jgi:hypothetical protein
MRAVSISRSPCDRDRITTTRTQLRLKEFSSSYVRPRFLSRSRTTRYSVFKDRTKPWGVCCELLGRLPRLALVSPVSLRSRLRRASSAFHPVRSRHRDSLPACCSNALWNPRRGRLKPVPRGRRKLREALPAVNPFRGRKRAQFHFAAPTGTSSWLGRVP